MFVGVAERNCPGGLIYCGRTTIVVRLPYVTECKPKFEARHPENEGACVIDIEAVTKQDLWRTIFLTFKVERAVWFDA